MAELPVHAQQKIYSLLAEIGRMFVSGTKVTLIVRVPSVENGDLLLTNDDFEIAVSAARKVIKCGTKEKAKSDAPKSEIIAPN